MNDGPPDNPMRIVHLEDSVLDHKLVLRALERSSLQFSIVRVETIDALLFEASSNAIDLVLVDYRLAGFTALDAWAAFQQHGPCPPFILISGAIGEAAAVAAIHQGISDYLHKDNLVGLERAILRAMEVRQIRAEKERADQELAASEKRLADFANYLQTAIEQERASIAREIHDDIGGSLAAAKLDLGWIARRDIDADTQSHIQAAIDMLQHALGASQRIMMDLRPAILDQGLFAAIQWLASSFERRTGIKTNLHTSSEHLSAPKPVLLAAYRTAQEALTNASKYAECTLVSIDLSDAEEVLTVEITDNGKGIPLAELQKPNAFGIRGLRERAKTVGGWLDVSTREQKGTSIILTIPLVKSTHANSKETFL
jgi:signal transduction histidine kinase